MRKPITVLELASLGLVLSACAVVVGSGDVITVDVPVGVFSRVDVSNSFHVTVDVGETPSLTLRIDENRQPHLDVGVNGDTLRIALKPSISLRDVTLEAALTVTSLSGINGSGASDIRIEDALSGDGLEVDLSGASFLSGPVAMQSIDATVSGASEVLLTGEVDVLTVDASGASQLALLELAIDQLDVELSGASSADVAVSGTLSANLSGASSLRYKGSQPSPASSRLEPRASPKSRHPAETSLTSQLN